MRRGIDYTRIGQLTKDRKKYVSKFLAPRSHGLYANLAFTSFLAEVESGGKGKDGSAKDPGMEQGS